ncbi:MAG: phosphoenolpyruvate--protein phosphotransferase [Alphaproteobacteria bacterium]|nr:phosphoenolpyruvate--protein phosphotransferase [Alphaproteobacteria bacterium]
MTAEKIFTGIGVTHGVAIGAAFLVEVARPQVPKYKIEDANIEAEQKRFSDAVENVRGELQELKTRAAGLPETAAEEVTLLLEAHLAMISGSRLIRGAAQKIADDKINAEWALENAMGSLAAQFRALKDNYIAARLDDVEAVGNRLLRSLLNIPYVSLDSVPQGGIVLAREISPAETALLDPRRFAGICTVHGGAAGHTAVMARSLGLPAVLSIEAAMLDTTAHGQTAVVDGIEGKLVINPAPETLRRYEKIRAELAQDSESLDELRAEPAVTSDGTQITLRANLELPRDVETISAAGGQGIGLFRTEFLFMNRATLPTEEEQFDAMSTVVAAMKGAPVTFRTLDIGGDKLAPSLGAHLENSVNPALGLRAIRLSLKEPLLLKTQFRAMIRAGAFGPVRILLPMVTTSQEVERARALLIESHRELRAEKAHVEEAPPPLGAMIEIPAAALSADSLAAVSDFFALGTNDLVQYTVAIDRGDDQVASLYNPLNPAVLRLIEFAVEAGRRAGISVSICGEMGADTKYTALLMGLGLREFSVGPASLPRLKRRIRELSLQQAEEHARQVMNQYDPERVTDIVDRFKP